MLCVIAAIAAVSAFLLYRQRMKKRGSTGAKPANVPKLPPASAAKPAAKIDVVAHSNGKDRAAPAAKPAQEMKSAGAPVYDPYTPTGSAHSGYSALSGGSGGSANHVESTVAEVPQTLKSGAAPAIVTPFQPTQAFSQQQPAVVAVPIIQAQPPTPPMPAASPVDHHIAVKTPPQQEPLFHRSPKHFEAQEVSQVASNSNAAVSKAEVREAENIGLLASDKVVKSERKHKHKSSRHREHHHKSSSSRRHRSSSKRRSEQASSDDSASARDDDTVMEVQREIDDARREQRKDKLRRLLLAREMVQDQIDQSRLLGDSAPSPQAADARLSPRSLSPRTASPRSPSPRVLPTVAGMLAQDGSAAGVPMPMMPVSLSDSLPLVVRAPSPRAFSSRGMSPRASSPRAASPRAFSPRASSPRLSPRLRVVGQDGAGVDMFSADQVMMQQSMPVMTPMGPMMYSPWVNPQQMAGMPMVPAMQQQPMYPSPAMQHFMPMASPPRKDYAWYM